MLLHLQQRTNIKRLRFYLCALYRGEDHFNYLVYGLHRNSQSNASIQSPIIPPTIKIPNPSNQSFLDIQYFYLFTPITTGLSVYLF